MVVFYIVMCVLFVCWCLFKVLLWLCEWLLFLKCLIVLSLCLCDVLLRCDFWWWKLWCWVKMNWRNLLDISLWMIMWWVVWLLVLVWDLWCIMWLNVLDKSWWVGSLRMWFVFRWASVRASKSSRWIFCCVCWMKRVNWMLWLMVWMRLIWCWCLWRVVVVCCCEKRWLRLWRRSLSLSWTSLSFVRVLDRVFFCWWKLCCFVICICCEWLVSFWCWLGVNWFCVWGCCWIIRMMAIISRWRIMVIISWICILRRRSRIRWLWWISWRILLVLLIMVCLLVWCIKLLLLEVMVFVWWVSTAKRRGGRRFFSRRFFRWCFWIFLKSVICDDKLVFNK